MEIWVVPRFIRPLQSDFCKGFFDAHGRVGKKSFLLDYT